MRYTVILVPADDGKLSALVPAMPGCFSLGHTRVEALAHVREAMAGWVHTEAQQGRGPIPETPDLILDAVSQALAIIGDMRAAGELPPDYGYDLELATVEIQRSVAA